MARSAPIIGSYAGGEATPYLVGRTDHSRYYISTALQENMLSLPHGAADRRGGTRFVAAAKDAANAVRVLPFEFSDEQAYVLEFGAGYLRVFMNKGQIFDGAVPYEIATPYAAADLAGLSICQSNDIAWITHPGHSPKKLTRSGHTAWALTDEVFVDGPYLDENAEATTLTPSALTGAAVTLTASAVTGINHGLGFVAGDVGRLVRIGHPASPWAASTAYSVGDVRTSSGNTYRCTKAGTSGTVTLAGTGEGIVDGTCLWKQIGSTGIGWGYGRIVEVTSTTAVKVDVKEAFVATAATAVWRLGLWSDTTGWPSVATFHQDRLVYGSATVLRPHRLDLSRIGDFGNFTPGTNDDDAIAVSLGSNKANKIRWLASARVLLVGTMGGEFVVSADSLTASLTPTNISAAAHTREGCAPVAPIETGLAALFVQRLGRKIHALRYDLNVDGYVAPEITLFAEQATRGGLIGLAWQKQPWGMIWAARADGQLVACTYLPDQEVTGWHRHPLGDQGAVESLTVIPGAAGSDELWLAVRRTVNGQTVRYIEVLEDALPLDGRQSDAYYVDCGLSLVNAVDATLTPAATTGAGVVFTAGDPIFDAGDVGRRIHFDHQAWETQKGRPVAVWTKAIAAITEFVDAAHVKADVVVPFPSTDPIAAGGWRLTVTRVTGLDHLEGKTVQILADGGAHADRQVAAGAIDLDWPASKIHAGLGYVSVIEPMPLEVGAATKRVEELRLRLLRSLGGKVGRDDASLEQILYRTITDPLDAPPPLFSGDKTLAFGGEWEKVGSVLMVQDLPLPFTVAATVPTVETAND